MEFRFPVQELFSRTGEQSIILNGLGAPINGGPYAFSLSTESASCGFIVQIEPQSIVYIRGIKTVLLTFDSNLVPNAYQSEDEGGISLTLSSILAQDDIVETRLVNADKGIVTAWDDYYFSQVVVPFSNINNYGVGTNLSAVDTSGKLQIWVSRKDGKDIIPASSGRPPIKVIIQVPGKASNTPVYSGTIAMRYPYFNPWYNIVAALMENFFAKSKWKIGLFKRKD